MWIVWSESEAQRCCKTARFLYCLGPSIVKYRPYKSYKSWHTCPTISLRMSILFSLTLYLKSRTFKGETQYIWPIYCGGFCFATWREQWALDQLRSEMLVLQCDNINRHFTRQPWIYWHELVCSFLMEPHISPNDLFDIFLVSLLQEHFSSEVPYSAEQTWHLIKLTYLVCIYTCRL